MKKLLSFFIVASLMVMALAGSLTAADRTLTVRKTSALVSTDWDRITTTSDAQIICINVFEGLYGINEARGGYYNELAKEVKISEDQLTYTITLNDATFQNGLPLKASDVV
ncbi:MAG: hypothetical protein LBS53_01975, partial [Synergistaceae bacterium]|nr:hypothetical protein [Synergistaceae bacterium]